MNKCGAVFIYLSLAVSVLVVFWPVRNYEFVNYDDQNYITENENVRAGLSFRTIRWAFTSGCVSNWHPLTWLSHMLDCQLFDLKAGGHHLTNVFFHIANVLLLFAVFRRMTGALWPSAFVAAVFGLHPLHVESVAWVAERKDVLSTFFWMLTMWAYVRYAECPGVVRYIPIVVFFLPGLMAKPMLVTLPFVLFLLDYWPLKRMTFGRWAGGGDSPDHNGCDSVRQKSILNLVVEKIPLLAFSAVSCIVTFLVQRSGGAVLGMETFGIRGRLNNAIVSYVGYIGKMLLPSRLAVFYPHPGGRLSVTSVVICGLFLVVVSVYFIYLARKHRFLAVGWLWYIGTLVPVIGLVQVGGHAMADRYTYIPLIGLFIIIAWGFRELVGKWKYRKMIVSTLAVAVILVLSVCSRLQLRHWRSSITLCQHAIDVTENNFLAYGGLGVEFCRQGDLDKGIEYLTLSLQIMPNNNIAHYNMGIALAKKGRFEEAIAHYQEALRLKSDDQMARQELAKAIENQQKTKQALEHYGRAKELLDEGRIDEAVEQYRLSLEFRPDNASALCDLGFALAGQDKFDEAIEYYKKAIEIKPDFVVAHGRLGLALAGQGKIDEAIEQFRIVLSERSDDVEMRCNVGILLERQGKIAEAIRQYRQALQIDPAHAQANEYLKRALDKQRENRR